MKENLKMANDNNNKGGKPEETNSPIVNVDWQPPTWTDQFQKFIVDLTGVVNDRDDKN